MKHYLSVALLLTGCAGATQSFPSNQTDNSPATDFDEKNGWATEYTVLIDPNFPDKEQQDIVMALIDWQTAVPVRFSTWIGACTFSASGQICIHYLDSSAMKQVSSWVPTNNTEARSTSLLGFTLWSNDHADIVMWDWEYNSQNIDNPDSQLDGGSSNIDGETLFWMAMEHELGHAQGLIHHHGSFIMNPALPSGANGLTADDANQWFSLRSLPTIPEDAGQIQL